MTTKRKQAVLNIEDEVKAGRLVWDQASVKSQVAPFVPRGQLDVLVEGQDDEGGDDEEHAAFAALWDDREDVSDDEEPAGRKRSAPEETPAMVPLQCSPEVADILQKTHEQRAALERLLADAADCSNPRVALTIRNALRMVERSLRSRMHEEGPLAAALQEYEAAHQRSLAQARAQAEREAAEAKRAEQLRINISAAARRLASQRARYKAQKAERRLSLEEATLHVDDEDLGAGRPKGGFARHRDARRALFMRLVRQGPPCPQS